MARIRTWTISGITAAVLVCAGGILVTVVTQPVSATAAEVSLAAATQQGLSLEFGPPDGKAGVLEAELLQLDGKLLAKATRRHGGRPVKVDLAAAIDPKDLASYYLRYRFDEQQDFRQRSVFFLAEILETTVLGQRDLVAGTRPIVRIMVSDRAAGVPVENAAVAVTLKEQDTEIARYEGRTNRRGELAAPLALPDRAIAGARLAIHVKSRTSEDTVEETVNVKSGTRTLLTTDKPLYQPAQTIHIRALSLKRPDMKPLAGEELTFEVEDSKGNKVFKRRCTTDAYGIAHADFVLADELNKGTYRVRAIVAGTREEKTVTVSRYVLPKFKVSFTSDRKFYQPGETVHAELQVDYFFGKPVAGGKVHVTCSKFDVKYVDFQTVEGKTDPNGHISFDVELPKHFVGQPLEAGKASAKFDIAVTDTADHTEKVTRNVTVTGSPILIAAVPESGKLIGGLENRIYVVTTYADATAAKCAVTWANPPGGEPVEIATDQAGFGQFALTPAEGRPVAMTLTAQDTRGNTGRATVTLEAKPKEGDAVVLLRTDRSICRVGDQVALAITSTRKAGPVYVDVIKDRQTYLTRTLELADGKAAASIALDAALAGTVQINAYLLGPNGVMIRDRRLVVVDPADDLKVAIDADSETYLPGGDAAIRFAVTDRRGRGVPSALGVMVVDEAVFALQEMQPGLEKVYFYLEKEIAKPRYEIHGYDLGMIMPGGGPGPAAPPRKEAAARVLLASAQGVGKYAIHVNTYQRDAKSAAFQMKLVQQMAPQYQKVNQALAKYSQAHRKAATKRKEGIDLAVLVEEGYLKEADALDPWGGRMKIAGQWCRSCQTYHGFLLNTAGIDGKWGTADDITGLPQQFQAQFQRLARQGGADFALGEAEGVPAEGAAAARPLLAPLAARLRAAGPGKAGKRNGGEPGGAASAAGAEPVRIRQYFPETLYFNPAVITDPSGRARLEVPMADSITTWRMTCMASSSVGQLGSTTAPIRVFQDFFVDVDFPVSLTQNDTVHVPVAVYNYLKTDQDVRLTVHKDEWYELKGPDETTVRLGPSQVKAVYFPIVARKVGFHTFTVTGRGAARSDAVARSVEIVPDGREVLASFSGRLEGDVQHRITIPPGAIEGASTIFVKVYPGMLSQVVEGLDKMLRMPFGCFEQTSSVTYPNILVLDYMKTTGKITPEIRMKAEGFINAGYQRLVSFEVPGGGFEWFGNPPAHRILTAYGLMEFHDMSKVHEVDPAIITRTQQWLAKLQEKDGSYKPTAGGIQEGAINKFTDDVFRNTAYITWALASTGYRGSQVDKGMQYLKDHLDDMKDTYTIALTANAFATVDPKGKTTLAILQTLLDKKVEKDELVHWPAGSETPTHGRGATADIEVTALAVQAFVRCGRELGTVGKAVSYLAKNKDAYGTWQSTQATIQALRAMLLAERGATAKADARIEVAANGTPVKTLRIDESNSDVLQLVDLRDRTRAGDNSVSLRFKGEGALLYQVVGRYYVPYPEAAPPAAEGPLSIDVAYDRTHLAAEDVLGVTATIKNSRPGAAQMVIVDLGLPPGFTLIPDNLAKLVETKTIEKYNVTGRQIILYLREVRGGKPVQVKYQLLAKYPLRAKTRKSVVYEYYNPRVRAEDQPIELAVSK